MECDVGEDWAGALRDGGFSTVPWAIVATCITAIVRGWLIPRKSHEEIVEGYKERAFAAELREQWWRDQAYTGTSMAGKALDITADLATRRRLIAAAAARDEELAEDDE